MGNSNEARPGWVRLNGSRLWQWEGGPLVIRLKVSDGWMLELSRHGLNGRISVPVDGPFETFAQAAECAERRLPDCQGAEVKGDPVRCLRLLREQLEAGLVDRIDPGRQESLIREAKATGVGLRLIGDAAGVSLDQVYRVAA